jgi:prophage regulatory protein
VIVVHPANLAPTDLITLEEVMAKTGMKKTYIYEEAAAGRFPKPVHPRGSRVARWVRGEVDGWNVARIAERDMGKDVGTEKAA